VKRDWTRDRVHATSVRLSSVINKHPLLVIRALHLMLMQMSSGWSVRTSCWVYMALIAYILPATKAGARLVGTDARLHAMAAALRTLPPFEMPPEWENRCHHA